MGLISILFKDPVIFIILVFSLTYSVIFHEMAHGWTAYLFGDNTAKQAGRLSFNPASHIDPIGTIALFIVGFGWARPVPVNYALLRNSRLALVSVSLAGCFINIAIATVAVLLLQFPLIYNNYFLSLVLPIIRDINIILGSFNLIPIPPLDGSKILMSFLPLEARRVFSRIEPYGFFILIFLIYTGLLFPVIVFVVGHVRGLIDFIVRLLLGAFL